METALYTPGLGYYAKDSTSIGRNADFYTSPHLHPIFGAMIGKQLEEMWHLLGSPKQFHAVEIGAGMGFLAYDILEYLDNTDFFSSLTYTIVERNQAVAKKQTSLLEKYDHKVRFESSISDLAPVTGCFLSNELLDAFPIHLVEMNGGLCEIFVSIGEQGAFTEIMRPCNSEIISYFKEFSVDLQSIMNDGYRTEVNLDIRKWLYKIALKLSEGFVLTIDYGYPADDYYSVERNTGTMLCYHKHSVNDNPYINIGEQDITAHVNFSALKKWGEEVGLSPVGFSPQGPYLISLGIDEILTDRPELIGDVTDTAKIKRLILPEGMGESHKVMVQYKGDKEIRMRGFMLRSRLRNL